MNPVAYSCHGTFEEVLAKLGISLAVTTYQAGQLCLIAQQSTGTQITQRFFEKPMGLYVHDQGFILGTLTQVWSFVNVPALASRCFPEAGYDALYLPQVTYSTGNMAVHDVALLDQQAIAVSSLFNCIVAMNPLYSFVPLWKPKFISGLVAEDRCHLNGLALENGKPRYVTVLGESDVVDGWREKRASGGCVIDVRSNEIICRGLSMPHAPRLYGGDLWVLASGSGELGIVTPHGWEPLLKLPGFLRGLAFHGPYAFVGLSKLRDRRDANLFGELPIEAAGTQLKCGIYIIHLQTGAIVGWLEFTEGFTEIYDVQILPARNPGLATMQRDEVQELFHLPTGNQMLKGKRS